MANKTQWSDGRSTAMHEAGHAVASWLLDTSFRLVTIVADAESLGHVQPIMPRWFFERDDMATFTARQRRWMENQVIINMAGEVTQRAYDEQHPDASQGREDAYDEGCGHDRAAVADLLSFFEGTNDAELAAYKEWLRQRTISLVANYRFGPAAAAMADELQRTGTVRWRRAKDIMTESTGSGKALVIVDGQIRIG